MNIARLLLHCLACSRASNATPGGEPGLPNTWIPLASDERLARLGARDAKLPSKKKGWEFRARAGDVRDVWQCFSPSLAQKTLDLCPAGWIAAHFQRNVSNQQAVEAIHLGPHFRLYQAWATIFRSQVAGPGGPCATRQPYSAAS